MTQLLATFDDPFYWRFAVTAQAVSMGVFLAAAGPLTLMAWRDPPPLRRYRIQSRSHAARKQVPKAVAYWLLNNLLMFTVVTALWPWVAQVGIRDGALPGAWELLGSLAAFVVLDDFVYYWMHRGLHASRFLYERIHRVHHRVVTPWAMAAHTMHPVEFLATGALTLLWPAVFGSHVVTVWCWVAFRQLEAADGHSGYVLPWNPLHLVPLYRGAGYHDFHHAKFSGNYSGFLGYLDGVFGAYAKGYREWEAARRGASPEA